MSGRKPAAGPGNAPGAPGCMPTWSSSDKDLVGCGLGPSRLWFTMGRGIVNEVYYPRVDIPQIRDLGFIVADDDGFWVEVKRLDDPRVRLAADGVPAAEVIHEHPRFRLHLRVTPDPMRDVLLIDVCLSGDSSLRPYVVLAPHLGGTGHNNVAEVVRHGGRTVLWAERGPFGLALQAANESQDDAMGRASAGYVGTSDGWQDFANNGAMRWHYGKAGPGNVALTGELPRRCVVALGLGSSKEAAATLSLCSLRQPFDGPWNRQIADWKEWHDSRKLSCELQPDLPDGVRKAFRISGMVLRSHQDKVYPGSMVASLSIPWGNNRDERGGYHLVWPRDLVECAGALLNLGAVDEARDVLRYLLATQQEDGHWFQNQWLGGKPFWNGVQLDEAGFPVLLAAALAERDALDGVRVEDMVRRALGFIVRTGPASEQDRWEEDAGVNAFSLSVCIAALVAGARFLEGQDRELALGVADYWNSRVEDWTTAWGTETARQSGVDGYYVREAPADIIADRHALSRVLPIKNRAHDPRLTADAQVSSEFLQLVRFGLRSADDPLIRDTIKVLDDALKVDLPTGPSWYRYSGDGYGERDDGSPFTQYGKGRPWPLLTGERGHYELCAGRDPLPYLEAMTAMSGRCHMIPEQVWDSAPIPERFLSPGRPSGSAMPLAWAHAEFTKLVLSRALGVPVDRPSAAWERYGGKRPTSHRAYWSPSAPIPQIEVGQQLVVCTGKPAVVHWGFDGWRDVQDAPTREAGLGLHVAELPTERVRAGEKLEFTFRRSEDGGWAGRDWEVRIGSEKTRTECVTPSSRCAE